MSHFTVMVIGDDVAAQLQPFHEFECTAIDDEFIQDLDITKDVIGEYEKDTRRMYVSPSGEEIPSYEDCFYRDPTPEETKKIGIIAGCGCGHGMSWSSRDWKDGKGYRTKVHYLPEGYTEKEVNTSELESFLEYAKDYYGYDTVLVGKKPSLSKKHKYGYIVVDEAFNVLKIIRRTNPNDRWDWYQVGGRWTGYFKAKDKYQPENEVGRPGLMTLPAKPGWYDQIRKGNIDVDFMRKDAYNKAFSKYEIVEKLFGGEIPKVELNFSDMWEGSPYEKLDRDEKLKIYNAQPGVVKLESLRRKMMDGRKGRKANEDEEIILWMEIHDYQCTKEEFAQRAADNSIATFAVVKDYTWYEKGKMGWWACVSKEKDKEQWLQQFNTMFDSLSDDTLITVVDCHI